jgi:hypothetical protein
VYALERVLKRRWGRIGPRQPKHKFALRSDELIGDEKELSAQPLQTRPLEAHYKLPIVEGPSQEGSPSSLANHTI